MKEEFFGIDPRTGRSSGELFTDSTREEIDGKIIKASKSFDAFSSLSRNKRAGFLRAVSREIKDLGKELLETADRETALGHRRLRGEMNRTCNQLVSFADHIEEGSYQEVVIDTGDPNRFPAPKPDIRRMLFPIGPVAIFGASNFPFAFGVLGGDTASALAAGCTVVVKGHPSHPETNELFLSAVERAVDETGIPDGVFSLVQGVGNEVGEELVMHPLIKAVGFTGSRTGGMSLFGKASARDEPIPFYAEMGSINPVIVTREAVSKDPASVAVKVAGAVLHGSGQLCTKPGLVLVEEAPGLGTFKEALENRMRSDRCQPLLNHKVRENLEEGLGKLSGIEGIEMAGGGKVRDENSITFENTLITASSEIFRREPLLHEERFGPVTLVVGCKGREDLLKTVECLEGQLTGTVMNAGEDDVEDILRALTKKVGRVILNGVPIGVEVNHSMQHGGPFPATTAPWTTSVGMMSIKRWLRTVAFQNVEERYLPDELKDDNPAGIMRIVDGKYSRKALRSR